MVGSYRRRIDALSGSAQERLTGNVVVKAFGGDGRSYAQFFFYQKVAPSIKSILTNSDGPFADTKEQVGGLIEVEAEDLDAAIAIAARIPVAFRASVELRPVVEH